MAKFNSGRGSGDKGRSRTGGKRAAGSSDDKKKDGYKAKRSFSKNKVFREIKEERPSGPKRSFGSDDKKPFKRSFDKDKSSSERPERESRTSDRSYREERPKRNTDERP